MQIVYKIQNKNTGKIYIGSSMDGNMRIKGHKNLLKSNKHPVNQMQFDYNKDNDCFDYHILHSFKSIPEDELRTLEYYEIKMHLIEGELYNTKFKMDSIYPYIKKAKLTRAQIAKAFGYSSVHSFNTSSANKRHMAGLDECLRIAKENEIIDAFKNDVELIGNQLEIPKDIIVQYGESLLSKIAPIIVDQKQKEDVLKELYAKRLNKYVDKHCIDLFAEQHDEVELNNVPRGTNGITTDQIPVRYKNKHKVYRIVLKVNWNKTNDQIFNQCRKVIPEIFKRRGIKALLYGPEFGYDGADYANGKFTIRIKYILKH